MQKCIRLSLERQAGGPRWLNEADSWLLNHETKHPSERAQDRLAALLKRQAREVMRSVTECSPGSISAQVARLIDLAEVIRFALAAELVDEGERCLSDAQLVHPGTLADYQAALAITRQQHRAPVFVSSAGSELAQINAKLDSIAVWLARGQA